MHAPIFGNSHCPSMPINGNEFLKTVIACTFNRKISVFLQFLSKIVKYFN